MAGLVGFRNPGIVCGLQNESACLAAAGIHKQVVTSGAHTSRATQLARELVSDGADSLVSFGLAGGLDPHVGPGTVILAERVFAWRRPVPQGVARSFRQSFKDLTRGTISDAALVKATEESEIPRDIFTVDSQIRMRFLDVLGDKVSGGTILGVDHVVRNPDQKLSLFAETEAMACDMESHVVAEEARAAGIPFIVLRVVFDPSHRTVPESALAGLTEAGGVSTSAVIRAVAIRPWEIFDLLALGLDARVAFGALRGVARRGATLLGAGG